MYKLHDIETGQIIECVRRTLFVEKGDIVKDFLSNIPFACHMKIRKHLRLDSTVYRLHGSIVRWRSGEKIYYSHKVQWLFLHIKKRTQKTIAQICLSIYNN